jgi:signal transduction histidine kinase
MRAIHWEQIKPLSELLRPPAVDPDHQAERLRFIERDVGLVVRAFLLGGLFYFLFLSDWFAGLNLIGQVALQVVRTSFLVYAGINGVVAVLYFLMNRLPFRLVRWTAFLMSFIDGLFIGVVTLMTGGQESLAYWVFLALMARNAFAFPVPSLQVGLNLLLIGSYLYAGFLDRSFTRFEMSAAEGQDEVDAARRARWSPGALARTNIAQVFSLTVSNYGVSYTNLSRAQTNFDACYTQALAWVATPVSRPTNNAPAELHEAFRKYTKQFERLTGALAGFTNTIPFYLDHLSRSDVSRSAFERASRHRSKIEAEYQRAADQYSDGTVRYRRLASQLPRLGSGRSQTTADPDAGATRAVYGVSERETRTQDLLLRILLMLLMTACCFIVQSNLDRHRLALDEFREFHARQTQLETAGRMAAQIAHQLKNPLAIINSAAFVLQRARASGKGSDEEQVSIIREEVERADGIITKLMGFSHLSEGQVEKLHLAEEIGRAVAQVFPPGGAEGMRVEQALTPDLPPLFMQRAHLAEILANLLLNAREAINGQGQVKITAGLATDEAIEVRIRDSGPGIPPDRFEQIFEPYFSTKPKGTGLGLAIVKQKAQMYGGTVQVESVLGKGATFILKFPTRTFMKEQT